MPELSSAARAAQDIIDRICVRPWGMVAAAIDGDESSIVIDQGQDAIDEDTLFEIGSVTKTVTGSLLASCVINGEAELGSTIADLIGDRAGAARDVTLLALATHRAGLPRLPPNLSLEDVNPDDPYATFDETQLLEALTITDLHPPVFEYSNYGFMLLGWLLSQITSLPYEDLARKRLFEPMQLRSARIGPAEHASPGYEGARTKQWWLQPLPGAGGVAMSGHDLARYLRFQLDEGETNLLRPTLDLATTTHAGPPDEMGLGWVHRGGGWWHNGTTGGFRAFVAFHRPTRTAVGLLANSVDTVVLDNVGFAVLTGMVQARS